MKFSLQRQHSSGETPTIGDTMRFALMEKDETTNGSCGVCKQSTAPREFDVVLLSDRGTEPVCDSCCEQHATELMYMRSIAAVAVELRQRPKPDKQALLDHYSYGTVQRFIQFDGHFVGVRGGDAFMIPDHDGDVVTSSDTWELRSSDHTLPVRVYVHFEAQCADVVRVMHKLADLVYQQFSGTDEIGNDTGSLESPMVGRVWGDAIRQERRERLKQELKGRGLSRSGKDIDPPF